MQVSVYQALTLLPDGELFSVYRHITRRNKTKLSCKGSLNLEGAVAAVEAVGIGRLTKITGVGYLIAIQQGYIKADGKKSKAFADSCGVKFKHRKKEVTNATT
jgi:hypothetical protein